MSVLFVSFSFAAVFLLFFVLNTRSRGEEIQQSQAFESPMNKPIGTIVTVAGESFQNEDGRSRQKIIAALAPREIVTLALEPNNRFDKRAIAVFSKRGQIGYVAKADASHPYLFERLREGRQVNASILNIIGGTPDKPNRGVWLDVDIDIRNEQKRLKRATSHE